MRSTGGWPDHFSTAASGYARYRPRYPASLFDALAAHAPARGLAWDCATGTGQAAGELAARFGVVMATDASARQIFHAQRARNTRYVVATAELVPLASGRADLITVAQAAHWLDLDAFYDEARRVARADGVLALWTYDLCSVSPSLDRELGRFYRDVVGPYWPPERAHVETLYRDLPFPFDELKVAPVAIEGRWSRSDLLGYVATWSAVKRYREASGEDPVGTWLAPRLERHWPRGEERPIRWPLGVRVGRVRRLSTRRER
ncbi:MAG: class I SAM-dependent methyltransferase [Gemmatimonadota bacterium]